MEKLAKAYAESSARISARLSELRRELKDATDPNDIWHLKRRIADLTPMLSECNAIAEYCRHYYERGYYITDGPFGKTERYQQRKFNTKRAKNKAYNGRGVIDL